MDAALVSQAHALHDAVTRLRRVGLIVTRADLSSAHWRASLTLDRLATARAASPEPSPTRIGFAYPVRSANA
jgi:hypothetical protein